MNEHAGPACALSGLIVGIFAVLLHDNSPPPPVPKAPAQDVSVAAASPPGSGSSKPDAPPPIQPTRPRAIAESPAPAEKASIALPAVVAPVIQVAGSEPPRPPEPEARPRLADTKAPVKPPKQPSPPSPRPSFAIVEPGESLADVARRVYGSKDATEALWKANRDQVERIDSPLAQGTLLRTP
jgi:nucleoid-associated protein YgaU